LAPFTFSTFSRFLLTEKGLRETQTLRAGCNEAEPKIFAPPQTTFPGTRDGQNLISWRWSHYLHLQTEFGDDRCTQFRVIVVTDPQTQTNKPTDNRLQYTAPLSLARSEKEVEFKTWYPVSKTGNAAKCIRIGYHWRLHLFQFE